MTPTAEPPTPRDELFRRIGRNVVNFQYLEATLRSMIPALSTKGVLSELPIRQDELVRKHKKSSLGDLADAFHKTIYQPSDDTSADDVTSQTTFAFSVRLESIPADIASKKRALKSLVAERNRLIHRDLLAVDLNSAEQCQTLSAQLDDQNVRLRQQINELNAVRTGLREAAEDLVRFLESDEFSNLLRGESDDA